jgi:hypothetical protein
MSNTRNIGPFSAAEAEARSDPGVSTTLQLAGEDITIRPVKQWRTSAIGALNVGDFDKWAASALEPDSAALWLEIDPTIEDVETMFKAWGELTGQTVGKSARSARS